jgi:hypothetical protein
MLQANMQMQEKAVGPQSSSDQDTMKHSHTEHKNAASAIQTEPFFCGDRRVQMRHRHRHQHQHQHQHHWQ